MNWGYVLFFCPSKKNLQSWNVRGEELFLLSLLHRRVLSSLDTSLIRREFISQTD